MSERTVAILLDDILRKLGDMHDLEKEQVGEGKVENIEPFEVTDAGKSITLEAPWFSACVWCDGPNSCWGLVNKQHRGRYHEIKPGEFWKIDMNKPQIEDFYFYCNSGETATLRISGVR